MFHDMKNHMKLKFYCFNIKFHWNIASFFIYDFVLFCIL